MSWQEKHTNRQYNRRQRELINNQEYRDRDIFTQKPSPLGEAAHTAEGRSGEGRD